MRAFLHAQLKIECMSACSMRNSHNLTVLTPEMQIVSIFDYLCSQSHHCLVIHLDNREDWCQAHSFSKYELGFCALFSPTSLFPFSFRIYKVLDKFICRTRYYGFTKTISETAFRRSCWFRRPKCSPNASGVVVLHEDLHIHVIMYLLQWFLERRS